VLVVLVHIQIGSGPHTFPLAGGRVLVKNGFDGRVPDIAKISTSFVRHQILHIESISQDHLILKEET
jgi:hypothetical protein